MANVFGQAKDLFKMQQEASRMQKQMKQTIVEGISKDKLISIRMNGQYELEDITLADELLTSARKPQLKRDLIEAFKDSTKKLQKELMKDMDISKMKSMLGV